MVALPGPIPTEEHLAEPVCRRALQPPLDAAFFLFTVYRQPDELFRRRGRHAEIDGLEGAPKSQGTLAQRLGRCHRLRLGGPERRQFMGLNGEHLAEEIYLRLAAHDDHNGSTPKISVLNLSAGH